MGRRKEVLIPGNLLPTPQLGRFHGVITSTKLCEDTGRQIACVSLSDERIKLQIPWIEVQQYVFGQPGKKRPKYSSSSEVQAGKPPLPSKRLSSKSGSAELTASGNGAIGGQEQSAGEVAPERADSSFDSQRYGVGLQARMMAIMSVECSRWPAGMKLWLKLRGYCPWPVLLWSARMCQKKDIEQLLATYKPGLLLVRCYGDHSLMWVKEADLEEFDIEDSGKFHQLRAWGRQHNKSKLVDNVVEEVENATEDADGEIERVMEIEKLELAGTGPGLECSQCQEQGAAAACSECERVFHTLCMQPPAIKASDLPDESWNCPFCGHTNLVGSCCPEDEKELAVERMGLTPDWIIQAAAFDVFQLEPPTPERPYIRGLLDPCTNSMAAPNIPAEVLYDKQMNGLKLSNSWAGHLILLNPPYTAATQWRFVNRAIDEVENDQVKAVLLLCRNSTDTAYFQRLRPYPRVLLRRTNTRFKDYSKTPIGFGICVFAIAKASCRDLYARFYDAFADMGEPNIPIDKAIMHSDAFHSLLERLRKHAEEHYRDHWIQCSTCVKWRIITYEDMLAAKDTDWTCRQLRPPFTSCRTPQTKREMLGGRYAALGADGDMLVPSAANVDYSIPRLDILQKQPTAGTTSSTEADVGAKSGKSAEAGMHGDTVAVFYETAVDAVSLSEAAAESGAVAVPESFAEVEAVACISATAAEDAAALAESVKKFARLPMRAMKANTNLEAPQVLSAIELARQARIAANRAYLAGLKLGPRAIANGEVKAVHSNSELVLSAARLLAEKAAVEEAHLQVDAARRHWARTSVACEKEASRLSAAMTANSEELELAKSFILDAETALATFKGQLAAKRRRAAAKEQTSQFEAATTQNSDASTSEDVIKAKRHDARQQTFSSSGEQSLDQSASVPEQPPACQREPLSKRFSTGVRRTVSDEQQASGSPGWIPAMFAGSWPGLEGFKTNHHQPAVLAGTAASAGLSRTAGSRSEIEAPPQPSDTATVRTFQPPVDGVAAKQAPAASSDQLVCPQRDQSSVQTHPWQALFWQLALQQDPTASRLSSSQSFWQPPYQAACASWPLHPHSLLSANAINNSVPSVAAFSIPNTSRGLQPTCAALQPSIAVRDEVQISTQRGDQGSTLADILPSLSQACAKGKTGRFP